ncbi:MAG: hypothetical protein INH41_30225 [Myxococcaceae bacterium]|jgi:hypothetical protein|nr:hypothetical protein [Myxococcaceae bacterium]
MRSSSGAVPTRLVWLVAGFVTAMGCSSMGGMGGCAALQPIPSGRYTGPKSDNAVNLRLSPQGINYLNRNWQSLIETFAPGRTLTLPVACTTQQFSLSVLGNTDVYIADQGNASGQGRNDARCDTRDLPAQVTATITGFSLLPRSPDALSASVSLRIDTGKLYVTIDSLCNLNCSVRFDSNRQAPSINTIDATVRFSIDQRWDKLLSFEVTQVDGTQICGASGAPAAPRCIAPDDLALDSEGGICSFTCDVLDIGAVKNFVLGLFSPTLQSQIRNVLSTQRCQACGTGQPPCPTVGNATSVCQDGVCKDAADNSKCVPRFLGLEGRVNLGATLGSFGAPPNAQLDLSFAAGSSVAVDQGASFGTRVGVKAVSVAPCVAPLAAPPVVAVSAPDFDTEAPSRTLPDGGTSREYHAALGFSSPFLNLTFHEAQQAGALCLQLDTNNVGLINTGLFKTLLPSLGTLATRDGKDAPMMVALRPGRAPTVTVGEGTFDPVTKRPVKPLIRLVLNDLSIDFYAMLDDRYARLFTITADISLPLSLIFSGCDQVTPAIGDLRMLIANVRTANSEMLAEDPKLLSDLIPAVIGLAEPAVAGALQPFTLPALGNFKLRVTGVRGVGQVAGTDTYNHLGLFAELLPANAQCAVTSPRTAARLRDAQIPPAGEMRLSGKPLPWPVARLEVDATGKAGTPEFAVRIDDGLWSDFVRDEGGVLPVSHPRFLLQGAHTIFVRSRVAEDPHGVSEPVAVPFFVDWDPPGVRLEVDREHDRLVVSARDVLTGAEALRFAYAVGDEAPSAFGPAREVSLSAVEARGGVRVLVQDEAGNVGEARHRPVRSWPPSGPDVAERTLSSAGAQGCSSTGGASLALALVLLRRRRR